MSQLFQNFFHEPYFTDLDFSEISSKIPSFLASWSEGWCDVSTSDRICVGFLGVFRSIGNFSQCDHSGGITCKLLLQNENHATSMIHIPAGSMMST